LPDYQDNSHKQAKLSGQPDHAHSLVEHRNELMGVEYFEAKHSCHGEADLSETSSKLRQETNEEQRERGRQTPEFQQHDQCDQGSDR